MFVEWAVEVVGEDYGFSSENLQAASAGHRSMALNPELLSNINDIIVSGSG